VRPVIWTTGTLALLASGGYVLVYVYRWEWHRALLVGILFLAALVGMSTALVLRRLGRLERTVSASAGPRDGVLQHLRAAPVEPPRFRWLAAHDPDRVGVFIPLLIGGGVLISGAAWLVERVAGSAARAGVEEDLAGDLQGLSFPVAPLVPSPGEVLAGVGREADPGLDVLLGPAAGSPR
jgi:H+/Cl- antiporter ClcA